MRCAGLLSFTGISFGIAALYLVAVIRNGVSLFYPDVAPDLPTDPVVAPKWTPTTKFDIHIYASTELQLHGNSREMKKLLIVKQLGVSVVDSLEWNVSIHTPGSGNNKTIYGHMYFSKVGTNHLRDKSALYYRIEFTKFMHFQEVCNNQSLLFRSRLDNFS